MRSVVIVVVVLGVIIFLGGKVNIGGAPLFAHLDAVLGSDLFMGIHDGLFGFMERGQGKGVDSLRGVGDKIDEFGKKPLGIDQRKKYRQLNDASAN